MNVLIAEDDLHIREGLRDILSAEGYQCELADNGKTALQAYRVSRPQLVLLDIMMPDQDGYSVCREIRQQDPQTAIIFISAKSEEIDRVLGLELGADDYIMKPFGKHEVVARIRAVTRRYLLNQQALKSDVQSPTEFTLGSLLVNMQELRAQRDGRIIDLSLRDCHILQLLYQQRNQVVSRDTLFNHCWGYDYLPNSRTLDQHISKLRKLIEVDPSNPVIIKTVHGVGYRYDE